MKGLLAKGGVVLLLASMVVGTAGSPANATTGLGSGTVFKGKHNPTLYYLSDDGKRYVFPNERTFKSWFEDFSTVVEVDDSELGTIPLGGNVRYRPGVYLVKITTDPKVYAVSGNGRLRWLKTEAIAKALYGDNWNLLVDDVPDAFFVNYTIDDPIDDEDSFDPADEEDSVSSIDHNRRIAKRVYKKIKNHNHSCENLERQFNRLQERLADVGIVINGLGDNFISTCVTNTSNDDEDDSNDDVVTGDKVRICHVVDRRQKKVQTLEISKNAIRAHLAHGDKLGKCRHDDDDDGNTTDTTAPIISGILASPATTTAAISWATNESSTSLVIFAASPLATTSSTKSVSSDSLVKNHSLTLTGLTASTTYYYTITSKDAAGNTRTSDQKTFTTKKLIVLDTTAPLISNIVITPGSTTSTIAWTTNEPATSKLKYATSPLATATTTDMLSVTTLVTSHSLTLTGLATSTQYFLKIESADSAGNTTVSDEKNFTTGS